jgi:hypothetical protein
MTEIQLLFASIHQLEGQSCQVKLGRAFRGERPYRDIFGSKIFAAYDPQSHFAFHNGFAYIEG